nr:MAG TPA: hypothetical protein [Crassvirales sp.]
MGYFSIIINSKCWRFLYCSRYKLFRKSSI